MKRTLITALILGSACAAALGQGAIQFANLGTSEATSTTVDAPVFDMDMTTKVSGNGCSAQLFYGVLGTPDENLTPLASPVLGFNAFPFDGYTMPPQSVQIPGIPTGASARLQMRVWNNQGGSVTTYDDASIRGASTSFDSAPLGNSLNFSSVPVMQGLQSFSLAVVPEPSALALALVGAAALLLRRRK